MYFGHDSVCIILSSSIIQSSCSDGPWNSHDHTKTKGTKPPIPPHHGYHG